MKRKFWVLIILASLSMLPVGYAVASSASCTGSGPYVCTLADSFDLGDASPTVLLGKVVPSLSDFFHLSDSAPTFTLGNTRNLFSDSFHLLDSKLTISISGSSVFAVSSTTSTQSNYLHTATTAVNALITDLVFPVIFMLVVIFIATKMGMVEFPILLGIMIFTLGALIYAGIFPTWVVIFPVLFAAVVMSLLVSKWLGSRGAGEA
jgi:hypothetical protein